MDQGIKKIKDKVDRNTFAKKFIGHRFIYQAYF